MVMGMTNRAKRKGDQGEREAVAALVAHLGPLALENARRKLGAGRRDDMGDLEVLADTTIQVKAMANTVTAVREAATGADRQAVVAGTRFALGLVRIQGSRQPKVRWLAAVTEWPGGPPPPDAVFVTGRTEAAIAHARRENGGIPRSRRIAAVHRQGASSILVAPLEAWVVAYREAAGQAAAPASAATSTHHVLRAAG